MEENNNSGKYFEPIPAEYAHIEEWVSETRETIAALDEAIKNTPKDAGPAPRLTPSFANNPPQPTREEIIAGYSNQKENKIKELNLKVDAALVDAKPEAAKSIKTNIAYQFDLNNQFKDKTQEELASERKQPREIDQSQDISLTDLYNEQIGISKNEKADMEPHKGKVPDNLNSQEKSLSEFYSNKYDIESFDSFGDDISPDIDKE